MVSGLTSSTRGAVSPARSVRAPDVIGRRLTSARGLTCAHTTLAAWRPPPLPSQLRGKPTLIQKHQAGGGPGRLVPPPVLPGGDDIKAGSVPGRTGAFFFSSGSIGATPATPP